MKKINNFEEEEEFFASTEIPGSNLPKVNRRIAWERKNGNVRRVNKSRTSVIQFCLYVK